LNGNSILTVVGSVFGARNDRLDCSRFCWVKIVRLSNSSLSVVANNGPPVVKSVVLCIVLSPIKVIRSSESGVPGTLALPPTTIVTLPVPAAPIDTV
jgi:hypothetical protein